MTLTEAELTAILTEAIHDATTKAVDIALADYAKKHEAELKLLRLLAVAGWGLALTAGTVAALK